MTEAYINNLESVLRTIGRDNTEQLIEWLRTHNFYKVPASCDYHNNCPSGLLKHALEVCNEALYLRHEWVRKDPSLAAELPKESVAIAALLHDVCKWNVYYLSPYDGTPKKNKRAAAEGHGLKSVEIIERCGYPLTHQERLAIWWHMGAKHEPSYASHMQEFDESTRIPLCNLIRQADYNATHLQKRFEDLLRGLKGYDAERVIRYLANSNFYTAQSGSHHHYSTGLVAHSIGTYRHMMEIAQGLDANEAAATALLHDIAMRGQSDGQVGHAFDIDPQMMEMALGLDANEAAATALLHDIAMQDRSVKYHGHGGRSMLILKNRLHLGLSDDALEAIHYHKYHAEPSPEERAARQLPIWQALYASDCFDADHDITQVSKHFVDEVW